MVKLTGDVAQTVAFRSRESSAAFAEAKGDCGNL
jgi:hypothetical protein